MLIPDLRSPQLVGMALFVPLSIISYIYSLLAGVFTTADCLSEEKREGTLGLLFLTDLKGYDIVLGKLAATSINAFYGMLAIFPVMAIPLLAGGVTGAEFWRVALVSVNNLLFSLAVGMFCSAVSKDERKAIVLAIIIVLLFTGLLPFIDALRQEFWHKPPSGLFFLSSPGYACIAAFDAPLKAMKANKMDFFYLSVATVQGLAWAFLLTAALIMPRTWQDRAESAGRMRFRERWRSWAYGSAATRQAVRRRLLELNPFYWLTGRDRLKTFLVWAVLGGGALLWAWGLWLYPAGWKDSAAYVWTALLAHTILKLWIAMESCRRFGTDRRSGALELLLSTPLHVPEIVRGQLLGLLKQFAGPAAVVLLVDFVFLLQDRNEIDWVLYWMVSMGIFVADLVTLSWVGMWTGLCSRHTNRAAGATVARVLFQPWMALGLLTILFAVSSVRAGPTILAKLSGTQVLLLAWTFISLANDLCFGVWARQRLLQDFRNVATQRFERKRSSLRAQKG